MITPVAKKILRRQVADLLSSAGCGCCRDEEAFKQAKEELAFMLDVEPFEDNSGYNFYKYRSKDHQ